MQFREVSSDSRTRGSGLDNAVGALRLTCAPPKKKILDLDLPRIVLNSMPYLDKIVD